MLGYREDRVLTASGLSQSRWRILDWMPATPISYHSPSSLKDGYFQSAAKGQEFVLQASPQAMTWTVSLLSEPAALPRLP